MPSLVHTADCEMWSRVIGNSRGVVIRDPLANYRYFSGNDTSRLARTGENVRDIMRLYGVFAVSFPQFSTSAGKERAANVAMHQFQQFRKLGDKEAAGANARLWRELASPKQKLKHTLRKCGRFVSRSLDGTR